jgi:E3 ubiquitin-protein ligase NEDD4
MRNGLRASGRFFGHALVNGRLIGGDLTTMFIAKLVGKIIGFEALSSYSPTEYNYFRTVHEQPGSGSGIPIPEFLDPNGRLDDVWPESQAERDRMLDLYISNYANALREYEFNELTAGLFEVIPKAVFESGIKIKELHEVFFGAQTVDLEDMFAHWDVSRFAGNQDNQQIVWLKAVLRQWGQNPDQGQEYLRKFVEFVTGSSRVVAGGFSGYRTGTGYSFTVTPVGQPVNSLPKTHNCFNLLDLPHYTSQARMEEQLREAIFGAREFGIL